MDLRGDAFDLPAPQTPEMEMMMPVDFSLAMDTAGEILLCIVADHPVNDPLFTKTVQDPVYRGPVNLISQCLLYHFLAEGLLGVNQTVQNHFLGLGIPGLHETLFLLRLCRNNTKNPNFEKSFHLKFFNL